LKKYLSFVNLFMLVTSLIISCTCNSRSEYAESSQTEKPDDSLLKDRAVKSPEKDTSSISAEKLLAAYVANEVKADYEYKGKVLRVTGIIQDIKKGISDYIYIILDGKMRLRAIQCSISDEESARKLLKGQQVSVLGVCDGLMVNVLLLNSFIEN